MGYYCEKYDDEETPAIFDKPNIVEYEVLVRAYDDYACCRLKNLQTGEQIYDEEVYQALSNTNIGSLKKLIGKKIRITSFTEIIE